MSRKISRRKFIVAAVTSVASVTVTACNITPAPPTGPVQQPTAPVILNKNAKAGPASMPAPADSAEPATEIDPEQFQAVLEDTDLAAIINILREKFSYLYLSETDLVTFASDFKRYAGQRLLAARVDNPDHFRYEVCSQFLMSTDFFFNNADETRPVKYLAYYDRYRGCTSPFARFD